MSIVICDNCQQQIDSDEDCDCFCFLRNKDAALCRSCRENADDDIRWAYEVGQASRD